MIASASYRRKDHLTRHLLQHQGKLFRCPIENCNREFTIQGNMKRHVKEFHNEASASTDIKDEKQYVCSEIGCGKTFKYPSKLRKHEDSHVKLDSMEAFCSEPGCMKYFTNKQCLEAHIRSCHQHITCEICGTKQLRKNIKRHLRTHEASGSPERIKCMFKGCRHSFSTKSNLQQHVKAVHHEIRPFACGFPGCGMRFAYKHVRDNHEKSGCHTYVLGDFTEADEQFRSRPRGGRKRKCPTVEMLTRKRVSAPTSTESCNVDSY
ncbi:Transcription factor IIIA [Melia azedarach]|nr:Transcription factor IIIA [Melia azedarach]